MNLLFQRLIYGKICGRVYSPTLVSKEQIIDCTSQLNRDRRYMAALKKANDAKTIKEQIETIKIFTPDQRELMINLMQHYLANFERITLNGVRLGPYNEFKGTVVKPTFTVSKEELSLTGLPTLVVCTIRVSPSFIANIWKPLIALRESTI